MRSKTPYILLIILLVLIIIGLVGWYFLARPKSPLDTGATATSTGTSSAMSAFVPPTPLHLTDSGQYYTADLEYPPSTPLSLSANVSADAAAVATMKAYAANAIATFKKNSDLANITPQAAADEGLNAYNKYSITSTYQLFTSRSTVSYVFLVTEDTLGAHPNSNFQTFTFDAKSGTNLQLADLFVSGSAYLSKLSTLTRAALTNQQGNAADPTFIDPGTTADANNFSSFAINGSNLVIFFAPYAVAPYSSGPQTARIPLSELNSVLQPAYK